MRGRRLLLVALTVGLVSAGCGTGAAPPAVAPPPVTTSPPSFTIPPLTMPEQPWPPDLGLASARVVSPTSQEEEVPGRTGDCIDLNGSPRYGPITVDCAAPEAVYRVVARVGDAARCAPDVDVVFDAAGATIRFKDGRADVALCLDVNWVPGECYEFSEFMADPSVRRSGCALGSFGTALTQYVRAGESFRATTDASRCPESAAVVYAERRVVQCLLRPT